MLLWTIQITFISILLIFLVHYLINFFKTTLTVPKIKDLVNNPAHKYENMYNVISHHNNNGPIINSHNNNGGGLSDETPDRSVMKNDLKNFLKKQLNLSIITDISTLDSIEGVSYSKYN